MPFRGKECEPGNSFQGAGNETGKRGRKNPSPTKELKGNAMTKYAHIAAFLACLVLLAGCGLKQPTQQEISSAYYGPEPKSFEETIKSYHKYSLFDPMSAVYEFPVPPVAGWMNVYGNIEYGWIIIYTLNAKNRMGAYTGFQAQQALIRNGKVIAHGPYNAGLRGY